MEETKQLVCEHCGRSFKSRSGLSDHRRRHRDVGPYKCCGKTFYSRANLSRHRCSVHGQEKKVKCRQCEFSCATKGDLTKHEKIHQEPKYRCDTCGCTYHTSTDLKDHTDQHQDTRSHFCVCGKRYRYRSGLSRHRREVWRRRTNCLSVDIVQ